MLKEEAQEERARLAREKDIAEQERRKAHSTAIASQQREATDCKMNVATIGGSGSVVITNLRRDGLADTIVDEHVATRELFRLSELASCDSVPPGPLVGWKRARAVAEASSGDALLAKAVSTIAAAVTMYERSVENSAIAASTDMLECFAKQRKLLLDMQKLLGC